jgi:GTP1/Obg family GTP-binding protein
MMSDYNFNLSGLGDSTIENIVRKSVENANYSTQELSDIQEPVQYGLFDSLLDQDNVKQSLADLQKAALLKPDIVAPNNVTKLKAILKKIYKKLF